MTGLFDKYAPIQARVDMMMKIGADALGVEFDDIISSTRGRIGNREILLAGTNNYLGLTFDEECRAAGKKAIDDHGTGTTGSRIANGTYSEHVDLEKALAEHFGMPSCIVFTTGYQTNLSAISGLAGDKDVIFMDADAHACIIDGSRLTNASTIRFRHNNPEDLDKRPIATAAISLLMRLIVTAYSAQRAAALRKNRAYSTKLILSPVLSQSPWPQWADSARRNIQNLKSRAKLCVPICLQPRQRPPIFAQRVLRSAVRRANEGIAAMEWNWLMQNGVYVNLAVPPGTPQSSSLLRISLSAAHTEEDVKTIIETFAKMKASQAEIMAGMMGKLQAAE